MPCFHVFLIALIFVLFLMSIAGSILDAILGYGRFFKFYTGPVDLIMLDLFRIRDLTIAILFCYLYYTIGKRETTLKYSKTIFEIDNLIIRGDTKQLTTSQQALSQSVQTANSQSVFEPPNLQSNEILTQMPTFENKEDGGEENPEAELSIVGNAQMMNVYIEECKTNHLFRSFLIEELVRYQ